MLRSNWRYVFATFGGVALAIGLWLGLSPREPNLPRYSYGKPASTDYHPGGSQCRPKVLSGLSGERAASERNRCADSAEQYRLDTDDLAQQTRSADAAQATSITSYDTARLSLAGAIIGLATLFSAAFAAWYARHAFKQAKRQADLQETSLKLLSRPFLYLDKVEIKQEGEGLTAIFHVKNIGTSPAVNLRCETYLAIGLGHIDIRGAPFAAHGVSLPVCPPNVSRKLFARLKDVPEIHEELQEHTRICLGVKVTFDTRFRTDKVIEDHRYCDWPERFSDTFYLNTHTTSSDEPTFFDLMEITDEDEEADEDSDWGEDHASSPVDKREIP